MKIIRRIWSFLGGISPVLDSLAILVPELRGRFDKLEARLDRLGLPLLEVRQLRADVAAALAAPDTGPQLRRLLERLDSVLERLALT